MILFNKFPNGDFVSNPQTGAVPHCRGIGIDLTLVDQDLKELDMGTDFDDFTSKAYHGDLEISQEAQKTNCTSKLNPIGGIHQLKTTQ